MIYLISVLMREERYVKRLKGNKKKSSGRTFWRSFGIAFASNTTSDVVFCRTVSPPTPLFYLNLIRLPEN